MAPEDAIQRKRDEQLTAALVKSRDRDRYWSALFAPAPKQPALLALYAFDAELDHILAAVQEPLAGEIRLQWWRDAIDLTSAGTRTGNPVADSLRAAILQHNLPKDRLTGMIDARVPALFSEAPPDEAALKDTLREKEGAVFALAAAILGDEGEQAKAAAVHAGIAFGLTKMLVAVPFLASRQKPFLPSSYIESRGIEPAAIYKGETRASFEAALADLRGAASRALQRFRESSAGLDPAAWPAFLPLTLVKPYLRAMAAPDYDPLHTTVAMSPLRRFWRIWRAARRKTL